MPGSPPRPVLLVEDDDPISELIRLMLLDMGLPVEVARSGPEAIAMAARQRPALVILDLGLPDMYGRAVGRRLRRLYPNVPIMVISALAGSTVAEDAWAIGAFAYLTKPFELEALTDAIRRGLALG